MNIEGIKLIDTADVADKLIEEEVEYLVEQHAGWGIPYRSQLLVTVLRKLSKAQAEADKADELHRALKGQQLQNGQLRKRLENLEPQVTALQAELEAARAGRQELADHLADCTACEAAKEAERESMQREIDRLTAELDKLRETD